MLAIVCPGQGSQSPGFLAPWLELDGVADRLAELSEAAGTDLAGHGTVSDADTIRDTAVAQPLIVSASLVTLRVLLGDRPVTEVAGVTAGHSVGEFTAAAAAGVLDDVGAVALVSRRARAMAAAAAAAQTGMSAVIGGDPDEVRAAISAAGLHAANVNGAGQLVVAGAVEGLATLAADPPARARVIPLQVAGAFHTPYMQPALDEFAPVAEEWPVQDPTLPLLSDADGEAYRSRSGAGLGRGRDVVRRLAAQIVAPVRWDLCQETLVRLGVTALVELAPGGVLTGLARRTMPGVETVAVKSPDDLAAAHDLLARHPVEATASPTSQESATTDESTTEETPA